MVDRAAHAPRTPLPRFARPRRPRQPGDFRGPVRRHRHRAGGWVRSWRRPNTFSIMFRSRQRETDVFGTLTQRIMADDHPSHRDAGCFEPARDTSGPRSDSRRRPGTDGDRRSRQGYNCACRRHGPVADPGAFRPASHAPCELSGARASGHNAPGGCVRKRVFVGDGRAGSRPGGCARGFACGVTVPSPFPDGAPERDRPDEARPRTPPAGFSIALHCTNR